MTPSLTSPVKSGVRVCDGPLTTHIAAYRAKLESLGYTPAWVLYHLRFFAKLDLWLKRRKQCARWLNEEKVRQFLNQLRNNRPAGYRGARTGLRLLLNFLRDIGLVAPKSKPIACTPSKRLADQYRAYLKAERGLDGATISNYSRHVDRLLNEHFGTGPVKLRALSASHIITRCQVICKVSLGRGETVLHFGGYHEKQPAIFRNSFCLYTQSGPRNLTQCSP